MADEYDEYEEEEEAPKPKRPRKPIDWPLLTMVVGSIVFIVALLAITLMAPARPFLFLRSGQSARPAATAAAGTAGAPATGAPGAATTPGTAAATTPGT